MTKTIVAFSGRAGAGKSTAAAHLVIAHGFQRIRFAGPLKDMMRALGLSEAEIEGDRKELPCDLLAGQTPRHAMQTIGTEWGRDLIAPDLWIRAWGAAVAAANSDRIVVDDCRFPNEAEAIRSARGVIIRVQRGGLSGVAASHVSEQFELPAQRTIANDGKVSDFYAAIDCFVRDLSWVEA